jgi:hypothetical protein
MFQKCRGRRQNGTSGILPAESHSQCQTNRARSSTLLLVFDETADAGNEGAKAGAWFVSRIVERCDSRVFLNAQSFGK